KGGGAEVIRNYFQVDSVKYLGDVAAGSEVTVFMSGLNGIRDYLNALNGASAQTVSILYNPGSAATSMPNAAGTVPIALPASGNVYSATVTVPSPSDALYFFNVATTWVMNGTAPLVRDTTYSAGKSVYPRNPKNAILKNGFSIAVALKSSSASGLSYDLTVAGQNDELLTPGVDYKPAVDSVGIWFRRNGSMPALSGNALNRAAVGAAADSLMVFPLSRLRSSGAIGFSTKAVANATFDTVYFAIAPRWKGAGITDSIARDLYVTTRSEPNPSRKQPNNDCYLDAVQEDKRSPVVNAALRTSEPFNEVARTVLVEFSLTPSMADIISTKSYTAAEVESGSAEFSLSNAAFAGEERLVYYRITVLGDDSGLRAENTGSFTVGRKAPLPLIGFTATPVGGTPDKGWSMSLSWNAVTPEANGVDDLASCEIRIIYSADPITEATADFTVAGTYAAVGAGSNSYTVNGLEKETNYWFAAVLADGSLMSAAEVRMENTGSGTLVANIVEIDSVLFNSDAANFKVYFRLTEKNENHTYSYYVTLGSDEVLAASAPQAFRISAVDAVDSLVTGSLGSSLVFDTVYTVHMYVFDAAGNESPIRSVGAVRIGPFEKQTIMVPIGGGSASADNGALKLSAVGWSEGLNAVAACTTAVSASTAGASKAGFEFLGNYGYSYKVTNDAAWVNVMGPFTISIAAGEIPSPYTTDDVRIYRWKEANNYWEVVYNTKYDNGYFTGTAIDSVGKEAGSTYRLMVSTTRPAITRLTTGTLGPVDASRSYSEHYDITSDVGNFRINMIVGPAGESSPSIIEPTPSSETTGTRRSVTYEIGTSVLRDAANRGVFAYLIATDGRNSDTLNSSRQVLSTSYGGFPIADQKEKKWYPFAAQVELDDKSVRKALGEFYHDDDEFKTYDTLYRLFRWYQTPDNRNDQNKWVEFKSDIKNDSLFDMEPGRLMWFKSAQYTLLEFGSATSTSLTETVEIRLPAEQWTDFVLPFRFNICLGDILEATVGAEGNIAFYKWIEPQSSKQKQSYITDMIMLTGADSIELKGGSDPYTVHNQSKSDVILRIPPKPSFLSSYSASNRRSAGLSKTAAAARAQAANDVWYYKIRTGTDNASELSSVLVGYSQTDRSFAVPPSFNNEAVVLVDSAGAEIGHHFGPAIARGRSYRLRFYNDDKQRSTFTFYAQPSANAPSNAQITFVKASTGEILGSRGASAQQSVSVAGMSHEDVFMIVGNSAYRAKTAAGPAGAKFKVSSISVNRAARSARINYYVPAAGIDRVEVSIYDIKGRQLWKNTQRVKAAAWNVTEWNSRQSKRGAVSAGLYIVRVKAVNGTGRVVGVDSKRVTFAR
ncbi:MAG: hypothetical protein LBH93_05450, partial [Chitinispirillales bacterium]|nr:hypothetical protein [Chitinispirillales bacterium]